MWFDLWCDKIINFSILAMQDSHSKTKDGKTRGQIYKKILGLRQTFKKT